jgi:hypothetical protein
MSIPHVGWEQSAQSSQAQPSPAECSVAVSDSNSLTSLSRSTNYPDSSDRSSPAVQVSPPPLPTRGFLNIVRHGAGASAIYVVTYCRIDRVEITPKPVLAEGARTLLDLLERLGVNLELKEVRGALEDIRRLGSANIPDLWLSDEQMAEKGLIED